MYGATRKLATPELLTPAGGPFALRAAVNNGADAVYLGARTLNARRSAENFTPEELAEATRYAHVRGARVYLTANILILESEMRAALDTIDEAWAAGVDAVIVQDLGLLRLLRRLLPDVRIHASTQIGAHNAASVTALAEMGVSRVTLARELALDEISSMVATSPVELECFVHGALCFCYSGQCLMSSMIGARSANRGLCAQPCRLAYALLAEDGAPVETPGRYLLSPSDLAGIALLPDLLRSGVSALKIEGRMKSPEYVALVTRVYRSALDRAADDPEGFSVTAAEWETLEEAFNRGFTEGPLTRQRGAAKMSYLRPNNRGVAVGRVASVSDGRAVVSLDRALDAEDIVEFWTTRGRFAQRVGEMLVNGHAAHNAPAGVAAEFALTGCAKAADRVFRVASAALLAAARRTFAEDAGRIVPVDVEVRLRVGERLVIGLTAGGTRATAEGPVVETARTKRVTAEEVVEHVGRFGGTAYAAASWSIDLDPAAGIGFSTLHAVRREAATALDAALLGPWARRVRRAPVPVVPLRRQAPTGRPELVAAVASTESAAACLAAGADRVLVAVRGAGPSAPLPARCEPLLPGIVHDAEIDDVLEQARCAGSATCGNVGVVAAVAATGVTVQADWGVGALNPWSCDALADIGAGLIWASPELSGVQLAALAGASPVPLGGLVYGRVELMVAEHCVIGSTGTCSLTCEGCERRRERWVLRDAKGYEFPVSTDSVGRSHIYNAVTLDLSHSARELFESGLAAWRLDLHLESSDEAAAAVTHWALVLDGALSGTEPAAPIAEPSTTGHFYRGVR